MPRIFHHRKESQLLRIHVQCQSGCLKILFQMIQVSQRIVCCEGFVLFNDLLCFQVLSLILRKVQCSKARIVAYGKELAGLFSLSLGLRFENYLSDVSGQKTEDHTFLSFQS